MAESKEELKSLSESERGEWKSWLKTQHSENQDHGIWSHYFMGNRWRNNRNCERLHLGGRAPKSLQTVTAAMKLRLLLFGRKSMANLDSILKSRDITLPKKVHLVKTMVFPVVMYRCESWTIKKDECQGGFWTVVLGKILESPLDFKKIRPVNPKGNQSWMFIARTDAKAKATILWPPNAKNWLLWKDPDAGKDWRQEEKGTTEDEKVEWHYRLKGHEFE